MWVFYLPVYPCTLMKSEVLEFPESAVTDACERDITWVLGMGLKCS